MARVIAPFKIVGTLDDLNYYIDENNINRVREKGPTGVTSEQFRTYPIFQKVRNHGIEFGRSVRKSQSFQKVAYYFFNRAKDGSFAGRANKLMFDILQEDAINIHGERTVENGMISSEARNYCIGFEGNKLRPLKNVLKTFWTWNESQSQFIINSFNPAKHIDWPEKAGQVHLAIARANWNYIDHTFNTVFSEEIILKIDEMPTDLYLKTEIPEGNHFELLYLFIGFSNQDRKGIKELKRAYNTVSVIWCR